MEKEIVWFNLYSGTKIIFCKKNNQNLKRLITKLNNEYEKIVIIDDEADHSSPNGKVNKDEKTAINSSIQELIGESGIYIGVTATPGRLDLNDTFSNSIKHWIYFDPHPDYVGKETFFPKEGEQTAYSLNYLDEKKSEEQNLQEALFNFLVNVALINDENQENGEKDQNYCFLVHTSGKKTDHYGDSLIIQDLLNILSDADHDDFNKIATALYSVDLAKVKSTQRAIDVMKYILGHIGW